MSLHHLAVQKILRETLKVNEKVFVKWIRKFSESEDRDANGRWTSGGSSSSSSANMSVDTGNFGSAAAKGFESDSEQAAAQAYINQCDRQAAALMAAYPNIQRKLRRLVVYNQDALDPTDNDKEKAVGRYTPVLDTIEIAHGGTSKTDEWNPGPNSDFVNPGATGRFTHEFGHSVYFKVLTDKERAEWDSKVWNSGMFRGLVSRYGSMNAKEGFAEAFSAYVGSKSTLPPAARSFMEKTVGKRK